MNVTMKIFITGTRGIPDIPGGVEKHCQELYPLIAAQGHEVLIATRKPYIIQKQNSWRGIQLIHTYAPHTKSLEAIVHTFIAVLKARLVNPDILHIHAIGPGLLVPFARLLGLKVVITNHGPDYDRQKWGNLAKIVLRIGERLSCKFANQTIVVSQSISNIVQEHTRHPPNLIYNGVSLPDISTKTDFLTKVNLTKEKYILAVSRFVPEKGLDLLINAFNRMKTNYKLVIAGDADHETKYSKMLKTLITNNDRIIHTGYVTGEALNQLYSYARLFVLSSYHEGLPIALLEAMSYGLPVLVSDIAANLEVALSHERYFRCGDVDDLYGKMKILIEKGITDKEASEMRNRILNDYNWEKIAKQTIEVYLEALRN